MIITQRTALILGAVAVIGIGTIAYLTHGLSVTEWKRDPPWNSRERREERAIGGLLRQ